MSEFDAASAYIELLKHCLNGLLTPSPFFVVPIGPDEIEVVPLSEEAMEKNMRSHRRIAANGFTMIGLQCSDNVHACVEDVLSNDVPGDMIEAGVWRGGTTMLMRALLKVHGVTDRKVVAADSFQGVPPPDPGRYPADQGSQLYTWDRLAVSLDLVKEHFKRFGLLDDQVEFVEGWFRDTLPALSNRTWSIVRLDGDLYESTIIGLESLYPGLSKRGYLIIDDYGAIRKCRQAVHDYRDAHGIEEEIQRIDWTAVYWQKQA
jgi:Macrocin-O-methyltransferase (TylF)